MTACCPQRTWVSTTTEIGAKWYEEDATATTTAPARAGVSIPNRSVLSLYVVFWASLAALFYSPSSALFLHFLCLCLFAGGFSSGPADISRTSLSPMSFPSPFFSYAFSTLTNVWYYT